MSSCSEEKLFVAASTLLLSSTYQASVFSLVHEFPFTDKSWLISSYIEEKLFVATSTLSLSSTYKPSVFLEINPVYPMESSSDSQS